MHLSREEIDKAKERGHDPEQYANKEVALGIRPEHMEDAGVEEATAMAEAEGSNVVDVEAQVIESMGSEKYVYFEPPREQTVQLEASRI